MERLRFLTTSCPTQTHTYKLTCIYTKTNRWITDPPHTSTPITLNCIIISHRTDVCVFVYVHINILRIRMRRDAKNVRIVSNAWFAWLSFAKSLKCNMAIRSRVRRAPGKGVKTITVRGSRPFRQIQYNDIPFSSRTLNGNDWQKGKLLRIYRVKRIKAKQNIQLSVIIIRVALVFRDSTHTHTSHDRSSMIE